MNNPFESKRLPGCPDTGGIRDARPEVVYFSSTESVTVTTAMYGDRYVFGYSIYYENGRHVHADPRPEFGLFATADDAMGYALCLIRQKARISPEAMARVNTLIRQKQQLKMF